MKNIVILISARGSNMREIVRAAHSEGWPVNIAAVISNRPEAQGLVFAREAGIPTAVVDHREYSSRSQFDYALKNVVDQFSPDYVVLVGFMRILTAEFVQHYAHRMLNIHPSLLPLFSGLEMQQQALAVGVTEQSLAQRVLEQEHIFYL